MHKQCRKCSVIFEITPEDIEFYNKIDVPSPTLCPDCRAARRCVFRNERFLYKRNCDFTKKNLISMYAPEKPHKVYAVDVWWSDKWNPMAYGFDFDFNETFFENFDKLFKSVPQYTLWVIGNENSDYVNNSSYCKDSYLVFNSGYNQSCYYSRGIAHCSSSSDVYFAQKSELLYECLNCVSCYNFKYGINCSNCSDSTFLMNCIGCKNCFGCTNLRQKEYYIFNQKYSKEDYEKKMKELYTGSYSNLQKLHKKFNELCLESVHKFAQNINSENCTGDYIANSSNCTGCFETHNSQDCKYVDSTKWAKDSYDFFGWGYNAELLYETVAVGHSYNVKFSVSCHTCSDSMYLHSCQNCKNCFGCVGLKQKEYCIFNKQYTKEEYEELLPKIIDHMKLHGELGEFFPGWLSPFGYNESTANDYYPKTKEEAIAHGFKWRDEDVGNRAIPKFEIEDDVKNVSNSITAEVLTCDQCSKPYRIIPQELDLYRKMTLPIPRKCFSCRHSNRLSIRNPSKLWDYNCDRCHTSLKTTYSPERKETIYCDSCYLSEVN